MRRDPVLRDIIATAHPNMVESSDIVQKSRETRSATWVTGNAHMNPDRHHFRRGGTLVVEHVYRIFVKREGGGALFPDSRA